MSAQEIMDQPEHAVIKVGSIHNDGVLDLICHFVTLKTGFTNSDVLGFIKGQLVDGSPIIVSDSVGILR